MSALLLYSALLSYAIAHPTSPTSVNIPSADSLTPIDATTSDAPAFDTHYRSTVEIILNCLTVIFASSWLCVHPNATGYKTTMWQRMRERFKLFALAVFAPEILAVFAFYQWRGSRKLYRDFGEKAKRLNISLCSGALHVPEARPTSILDGQRDIRAGARKAHAEDPSVVPVETRSISSAISRPAISEKEEQDPESGGPEATGGWNASGRFWRTTPWPSIKAWARTVLSYGTGTKESKWSHTHAHFVQMGGIVFHDVADGKIGFKRPEDWSDADIKTFFAMNLSEAALSDKSKAGALAKTLVVAQVMWFLIQAIARAVQGLPIALLEVATLAFIAFNFAMYLFWWNKPLDVEYPLELLGTPDQEKNVMAEVISRLVVHILLGFVYNIPIGLWLYSTGEKRYPRLYSFGKVKEVKDEAGDFNVDRGPVYTLLIAVTSSAFGAFHTIGWYLPSPSQVERTLWRISCLVLTLYPFALLAMSLVVRLSVEVITQRRGSEEFWGNAVLVIFVLVGVLCGAAYVGARLTIIFLPFFELRDLPPLVHETVSWSRFLTPI